MRHFSLLSLLLLSFTSSAQNIVEYRVTFVGTWVSADSSSYPSSAHFTDLVGATHIAGRPIWARGGLASNGVEAVAELGSNFSIETELAASAQAGVSGPFISLSSLFNLPNSVSKTISVNLSKPNITLISMLAPSSDWFVGVSDLPLRNNAGWIKSRSVDLHPYDAGTENGTTFSLSNPATNPAQPIALIGNSPFFLSKPVLGRIEFELLTVIKPPMTEPPISQNNNVQSIAPVINLVLDQ